MQLPHKSILFLLCFFFLPPAIAQEVLQEEVDEEEVPLTESVDEDEDEEQEARQEVKEGVGPILGASVVLFILCASGYLLVQRMEELENSWSYDFPKKPLQGVKEYVESRYLLPCIQTSTLADLQEKDDDGFDCASYVVTRYKGNELKKLLQALQARDPSLLNRLYEDKRKIYKTGELNPILTQIEEYATSIKAVSTHRAITKCTASIEHAVKELQKSKEQDFSVLPSEGEMDLIPFSQTGTNSQQQETHWQGIDVTHQFSNIDDAIGELEKTESIQEKCKKLKSYFTGLTPIEVTYKRSLKHLAREWWPEEIAITPSLSNPSAASC